MPFSSSGLFIVRLEMMEEVVIAANVNMSVELQSIIFLKVPTRLSVLKPLEIELISHDAMTLQLMTLPLQVHWYEATSLEHTEPSPISCVD